MFNCSQHAMLTICTKRAPKQSPDPKHVGPNTPGFEIPGSATVYICALQKWLGCMQGWTGLSLGLSTSLFPYTDVMKTF